MSLLKVYEKRVENGEASWVKVHEKQIKDEELWECHGYYRGYLICYKIAYPPRWEITDKDGNTQTLPGWKTLEDVIEYINSLTPEEAQWEYQIKFTSNSDKGVSEE